MAIKTLTTFKADERGAVAPIFGVTFLSLVLCMGAAIDANRLHHSESVLASAADAASLAGGKALIDNRLNDQEITDYALKFFYENARKATDSTTIPSPVVTINRATGEVKVSVTGSVKTAVMGIAGIEMMPAPTSSTVIHDTKDIELGLALDVTGSMRGAKLDALKVAAKDMVDILIPNQASSHKVRIGLAPYSDSVNAGDFAKIASGGVSASCVHERGGSQAFTDANPSVRPLGFSAGMICPTAKIQPMTADKTALKTNIDGYRADGWTAGHIGAAWASYLISPEWNNVWPAQSQPVAYGNKKTIKAMVLMTDGDFNTQYVNGNGNSARQAREICKTAKERNVVVYSIAFQSPPDAEALLKTCASSNAHFYNAQDATTLRQAFIEIAQQLNNLRVAQ